MSEELQQRMDEQRQTSGEQRRLRPVYKRASRGGRRTQRPGSAPRVLATQPPKTQPRMTPATTRRRTGLRASPPRRRGRARGGGRGGGDGGW